ncbi:enoyl-CoA hydratase/carnithine racemase [Advenella incenata]|uniref:Enoyl-CoA hydratase/carnithine racemase n=1 Tax=Advenella incenata TaxID=267800 RepID=A0A4V2FRU4_9BURK|nr:enoyl-CoA hydratase/isomerase family protein [Advenella incenata]RZT91679.1 enoyl-CoA hydratase/carnithine racemase [Advenella incenata]
MLDAQDVVGVKAYGAVTVLTIQRGFRRNAMDQALIDELKAQLLKLDRDPSVGAIVLQGENNGFCSGSDLKFISQLSVEDMARFEQETGDMARLFAFVKKPVIAAVEGFAIGGGFILAISCDVVVAGEQSRWSLPEVPHGWLTPWGLNALIERVGRVRARNLCFCLDELSGKDMLGMGATDYTVPDGQVLDKALELATRLAALPRAAVASTKRFFANQMMSHAEVMDFEANHFFVENCAHPDAASTLNKHRKPKC